MASSLTQRILTAFVILFGLIAFMPLGFVYRFFFVVFFIFALGLLLHFVFFADEDNFRFEPEYENWRAKTTPVY